MPDVPLSQLLLIDPDYPTAAASHLKCSTGQIQDSFYCDVVTVLHTVLLNDVSADYVWSSKMCRQDNADKL